MPLSTATATTTDTRAARGMPHVLVIENDMAMRHTLIRIYSEAGYPTCAKVSGKAGLKAAAKNQPDLVVLSPRLPDLAGATLLADLQAVVQRLSTVVVARDATESELVDLLDAGADDCMIESRSGLEALLARSRAVLRRTRADGPRPPVLCLGGLRIDLDARHAQLDGAELALSPREFDLLAYLGLRAGQVVSRRELMANVWRLPGCPDDKTIKVHVSWLRRKLNDDPHEPRYLHTLRGVGLRLDIPRA